MPYSLRSLSGFSILVLQNDSASPRFTFRLLCLFLSLINGVFFLRYNGISLLCVDNIATLAFFQWLQVSSFFQSLKILLLLRVMAGTVNHTVFSHWLITWVVFISCYLLDREIILSGGFISCILFFSVFTTVTITVLIFPISCIFRLFYYPFIYRLFSSIWSSINDSSGLTLFFNFNQS